MGFSVVVIGMQDTGKPLQTEKDAEQNFNKRPYSNTLADCEATQSISANFPLAGLPSVVNYSNEAILNLL